MTASISSIKPCAAVPTRMKTMDDAKRLADTVERLRRLLNQLLGEVKDHETRLTALEE